MKSTSVVLLLFLSLAAFEINEASIAKCDRIPEGSSAKKSPPDGRFRLRIANDPARYVPGETYNISLEGIARYGQANQPTFIGFFLTTEKDFSSSSDKNGVRPNDNSVGTFHFTENGMIKASERCNKVLTHTSSFAKESISVLWVAPPGGSGCIVFKSTVIEHRDVWYSDEGALSRVLCEDDADSGDHQPMILEECTACDEAKYELTFEGLWSRQTHPKDFPANVWLTKFSDVIGASHAKDFTVWTYGQTATDGLQQLVEYGTTTELESELKNQGANIRTIIKARGIAYPNVTGKTFAVFRVDAEHHLVSLASAILPAPDWFVGVSGLELCLSNGSWIEEKVINLYPYDAGTDSGPTYISSRQPTMPKEAIRRIKPNQPNDPRSPFHDTEILEMKPLARLYLTRQRLYEKNCENQKGDEEGDDEEEEEQRDLKNAWECATRRWSEFSECDNPCGAGQQTRTREYRNPDAAEEKGCRKKLEETQECQGTSDTCNGNEGGDERSGGSDEEQDEGNSENRFQAMCALTEYSQWSECSSPCGKGEQTRTRDFVHQANVRTCKKRDPSIELEQTRSCEGRSCTGNIDGEDEKPVKKNNKGCPFGHWSAWSVCSASCGIGEKVRVRLPTGHQEQDENLQKIKRLYKDLNNFRSRLSSKRQRGRNDEDEELKEHELNALDVLPISNPDHPCFEVQLIERDACGEENEQCENDIYGMPPFCMEKPLRRNCKKTVENRWFYKKNTESCGIFTYTGCESKNNFETEELCMQTCARKITNGPLRSYSLVNQGGAIEKVDCKVTHWKHEACNATCGEGFRWKYRSIIQHPLNGGLPCPHSMVHMERCFRDCGNSKVVSTSPAGNPINPHHHQCRYSEWSAWSPCSKSCGDSAVQIRTRTVLNHRNTHLCIERLEERRCEVMPCLVGSGYSYNYNYRS